MVTETGRFLDPLADKILVSSAFISFAIMGLIDFWMVAIIIFRDLFVTGLRVIMSRKGFTMMTSKNCKIENRSSSRYHYFYPCIFELKGDQLVFSEGISLFRGRVSTGLLPNLDCGHFHGVHWVHLYPGKSSGNQENYELIYESNGG